jgi:hypothetical protein
MSDNFLSRWSRRKQEARRAERQPEPVAEDESRPASEVEDEGAVQAPTPVGEEPALTPEEVAQLPGIEELTVDTDISAFLRKGVPEALRNAALRRMWVLDPAIRDFVGEARDYAYDWNTPGGVPGSGELLPGQDVQAMVRQVFGEGEPEERATVPSGVADSRVRDLEQFPPAETSASAAAQKGDGQEPADPNCASLSNQANGTPRDAVTGTDPAPDCAASQQAAPPSPTAAVTARRQGGAKPV